MAKLRLGLIGCGGMSKAHLRRFHVLGERLELKAAVDVTEERARQVAEQMPGVEVATDYRLILDQVDAVWVVLPHHLHHPVAKACLEAGKHVLLEKPMANTQAQCQELIETAVSQQRTLMVAYCMRYHPLVVRMKELLAAQTYGPVFQVSIWTEQLTRYTQGHWALKEATLGGGQFFSHGCHYVDILLWYLGRPVRGTHLGTKLGTPWMEREGTSNVTIEFEGGRLGYHFGTWGARGTRMGYAFHAHCEQGLIEADISGNRLLVHQGGKSQVLLESQSGKHTENEMAHFLDCVHSGQTPLTNGPDSLEGLRLIWRLYEAEEQGGTADLRGLGLSDWGQKGVI